ncbi:hypothetical protein B645_07245 [Enterococcus hirae 88-15-E09]|nr:hypothetical protein B645_07245 [Enterococcus hirae 88-15-E09]
MTLVKRKSRIIWLERRKLLSVFFLVKIVLRDGSWFKGFQGGLFSLFLHHKKFVGEFHQHQKVRSLFIWLRFTITLHKLT